MTKSDLERELSQALDNSSEEVIKRMEDLIDSLPEKARSLNVEIFPSQDGDGFFTVHANIDGPDLYVLNKYIRDKAEIFGPKHTEHGMQPYIPLVDPFEVDYEVNDLIVDCVGRWLANLWSGLDASRVSIPVLVVGHEDYGTTTPIELKPGDKNHLQ